MFFRDDVPYMASMMTLVIPRVLPAASFALLATCRFSIHLLRASPRAAASAFNGPGGGAVAVAAALLAQLARNEAYGVWKREWTEANRDLAEAAQTPPSTRTLLSLQSALDISSCVPWAVAAAELEDVDALLAALATPRDAAAAAVGLTLLLGSASAARGRSAQLCAARVRACAAPGLAAALVRRVKARQTFSAPSASRTRSRLRATAGTRPARRGGPS